MTLHPSIAAAALCAMLAGCAGQQAAIPPAPQTPQQALFETETAYASALVIATSYVKLPRCGGAVVLCSDAKVTAALLAAEQKVVKGLPIATQAVAAYAAIAAPGASDVQRAQSAVDALALAVADYKALTTPLKVQ